MLGLNLLVGKRDADLLLACHSALFRNRPHFGDHKSVGQGVGEMRVHVGKGYRVYYTIRGNAAVILLCGGGKSSQRRDIERAHQMARDLK